MPNDELLSISEAAELLGVDQMTLRRWDASGDLRPDFVSPGGHRKYRRDTIETYSVDLSVIAEKWASAQAPETLKASYHCDNSGIFQVRLHRLEGELIESLGDQNYGALVNSVAGEIGNNSFDHNYGNWPDVPGVFFAADLKKRMIVLADRGLGILATLKRVRPTLEDAEESLKVAFTEIVTGRAPEPRGNGLKYVLSVVQVNHLGLTFQSGDARIELSREHSDLVIKKVTNNIRGTFAVITY